MNHAYRPLWNAALDAWVAVPETAKRHSSAGRTRAAATAMLCAVSLGAQALPTGGAISAGTGAIGPAAGGTMTVNQTSQNLAINWLSFNIGSSETVNFAQPNAAAIALNRVLGADGSSILGKLNANGQVWILNPNGVLFGKGAEVNVGGLVASTLGLTDADFLAGKRSFSGAGGAVTNQGTINAGYAALLGEQVRNEGVITARLGTVALAAGNKVTLDFAGDRLLGVQVDEGALHALAENKSLLQADGGLVVMTAKARDALLDTAVNNTGVVQARAIENRNGRILLLGDMRSGTVNVGGTLDASAPVSGDGGFIETSAARVKVADGTVVTTKAANGRSGAWLIDPVDFTISAGSGALTGSGIGATTLSNSLGLGNIAIATDGSTAGNGDIFVNAPVSWSTNTLKLIAHGNIYIDANLNGSGAAKLYLAYGQQTANGNGYDYFLRNGARVTLPAGANFTTEQGYGADNTILGDGQGTTTNWTVITGLGTAASSGDGTLQGMRGGLAGNYVLGADIDASATSGWNAGGGFASVGATATPFTGKFDGLGHTISGLFIDYGGAEGVGLFGRTNNAVLQNVGLLNVNIYGNTGGTGALVGVVGGASSVIRNSYADGGSVKARSHYVGGLAGVLLGGSISYSYANVSVESSDGGFATDAFAGGLVGSNSGAISYSYATGSVTGNAATPADNKYIGGLAGRQNAGGSISNSYATGAVSAVGGGTSLGGLVGNLAGGSAPTSSYWDTTTTGQATSSGGGTGLTTAQWSTNGPFSPSPSGGAWSAADWGTGNPYPGLKALPYITIIASASQTYGSAATFGIASILDQTGANASGLVNTAGLVWTSSTTAASPVGTIGAVSGTGATATGYQILYAGSLTVVAKAPPTVSAYSPVPQGAPADIYTGAVVSAAAAMRSAMGAAQTNGAATGLAVANATPSGLPNFSIRACGQNLPPAISGNTC